MAMSQPEVAKERRSLLLTLVQHVWAIVLAGAGQTLGTLDVVAHDRAAVCDELGARPHGCALRCEGGR
jgi:hypothetical protein